MFSSAATFMAWPAADWDLVDAALAEEGWPRTLAQLRHRFAARAHLARGDAHTALASLNAAPVLATLVGDACLRSECMKSRSDLVAYAEKNGIPVPVTQAKPWSQDANLLHVSFEGGELEDPWNEPAKGCHRYCTPIEDAPDKPQEITLDFEAGNAVALNGKPLTPARMILALNELGGRHGIGRVDMLLGRASARAFAGVPRWGQAPGPG